MKLNLFSASHPYPKGAFTNTRVMPRAAPSCYSGDTRHQTPDNAWILILTGLVTGMARS